MSLADSVMGYCERTGPEFWAEPVNALSNVSFAIAACLLAWTLQRSRPAGRGWPASIAALPALLALVAVCSFLFHTLARVWAGLADQLSILLFGCVFLYAFLRHVAGLAAGAALAGAVAFSAASYMTPRWLPAGFLNQSGAYFPYIVGLTGIAIWLRAHRRSAATSVVIATGTFCVSLALRTVDRAACQAFPLGTHFLWHLLNGAVLYALASALAREAVTSGAARVPGWQASDKAAGEHRG